MNEDRLKELVPDHMHQGLRLWIEQGVLPGGFMTAVLENDLKEALARADHINRECLFNIVSFLYNFAPGPCWGSPEKVSAWENRFNDSRAPEDCL